MRAILLAISLSFSATAIGFTPTSTPVSPGGLRAAVDLPGELHQRNTGGSDGAGLCVFSAFEDECEWMGYTQMRGFHKWMENYPGGGWPEKLDKMVAQFCKEKGVEIPPYIQHIGGDEDLLALAIKTRRGACITYAGMDDFYSGDIAHMVVLSEFGRTDEASIMDNNRPGEWVWMSRKELTFRWKLNTVGQGWAVVLLGPPPTPSEDGVDPKPVPKPTPKPKPKPRRPFRPWLQVKLSDGAILWKLFDEDGKFYGVWDERGWHRSVTPDGWTPDASGEPPVAPPVSVSTEVISWRTDYDAATGESQKENKPILLIVSSRTCPACRKLDRVFTDPTVVAKINALFIPVKVEDPNAEWRRVFNVSAYPTSIVISVGGAQIVDNVVGAIDAESMLKFLQANVKPLNFYSLNMGGWSNPITKDDAHELLDDSDKWFVTLVVKDEAERKEWTETLLADDRLKDALAHVHLNVYAKDFWASARVKHALTVQKPWNPTDNRAVWFSDEISADNVLEGLVKIGLVKREAPEPKPVAPPVPVSPVSPSSPSQTPADEPVREPITIPLWLFWSVVGGVGYSIHTLLLKR